MKTWILCPVLVSALGLALCLPLLAEEPLIPPSVAKISPVGMKRGTTVSFTIEGRSLTDASKVFFDAPGLSGKVTGVAEVPEKITGPRAGEDLEAQVPLGTKQTAQVEITAAPDAVPGIHRFRVKTPLGTSNTIVFAVGTLPEIKQAEPSAMESGATPQIVELPATLIGTISTSGAKDTFQFDGKAGEDIVFRVMASELGSKLTAMITLSDDAGHVLETSAENANRQDAELNFKLPHAGQYRVSITDRDLGGGADYFYRMDAGDLPYVTSVFPLGIPAGQASQVTIRGVNLGGLQQTTVAAPAKAEGWSTMPLGAVGKVRPINEVKLAVGNEPEIQEQEPNDTIANAQVVSLPVTINGHIDSETKQGGTPDEDYFRFHARKGERLNIDVAAARLGSPLDSVIEVLDGQGNSIPRATIRCLNETTTTLADRDSRTTGIRLVSTASLHEEDYVMVGDELNRIDFIPDQPDADTILKGMGEVRMAYLGTSPDVHAVNTPVYRAQILPPDADFPSNGLPVFHLEWRNDDGGPGYGADSMLDFVVPADGDYFLHLKDVRGMEGPDFAYRLTLRDEAPDFRLRAEPDNPNIPQGGSVPVTVSLDSVRGVDGAIAIEVNGLPKGVSASPATILPGQMSTMLVLSATPDAALDTEPTPIKFVGHAVVNGHDVDREANSDTNTDQPLQLASISPSPDVIVTTEVKEVALEPGKEVKVTLHIERRNGFKGRVPCSVENLPPGVRVVNVGLNGVLVTEAQSSRTITLKAEDWAKPITQPIYVVGLVESNSPTMHPSAPLLITVDANNQAATAKIDAKVGSK
ncbi:MAG: hypothetical protein WB608_02780 [Terracidiphilus sp.]